MGNFVSYDNATTLMTAIANKFKSIGAPYVFKGDASLSSLPPQAALDANGANMIGWTFNMSEEFTTDERFHEGVGKTYPAGTNISIAKFGTDLSPTYKFEILAGLVDLSDIEGAIDALNAAINTAEFADTENYETGDVVWYDSKLYKFKSDHSPAEWSDDDTDEVTVIDLIQSAEPDSLTTTQINALIALLD